jgi:hypothetical protein
MDGWLHLFPSSSSVLYRSRLFVCTFLFAVQAIVHLKAGAVSWRRRDEGEEKIREKQRKGVTKQCTDFSKEESDPKGNGSSNKEGG